MFFFLRYTGYPNGEGEHPLAMTAEELCCLLLALPLRDAGIEIHPVDPFDPQRHMVVENVGYGPGLAYCGVLTVWRCE